MSFQTVSLGALPGLSSEDRDRLHALWITSVDELWALHLSPEASPHLSRMLAPDGTETPECVNSAPAHLSSTRLQALKATPATRGLGYVVPADEVERLMQRPAAPPKSSLAAGLGSSLPSGTSLLEAIGPVKDQGQRGTCVAFAWCGLREYWSRAEPRYSEQFLYWACKQLDGMPDEEGSFIRTGAAVLREMGVCRAPLWPYTPLPVPGSIGQGPPPDQAVEQAPKHALAQQRVVQDSLIEDFKAVLSGHPDGQPCPVVFGVLVFGSWMHSPEVARTGKIHLPLPGEFPIGGHAMCAVGYQDDPNVPGGGFLIVRNSWGEGWAADSPFRQGHAMLPYAYVERFCSEAFAAYPADHTLTGPRDESGFVRVLEKDARDYKGERLPAGTEVLANPLAPEEFLTDTPGNRQRFEDHGHAWSDEVRTRYWLPSLDQADAAARTERAKLAAQVEVFMANTATNLADTPGKPLPRLGKSSLLTFLVDPPAIQRATLIADLGSEHALALAESAAPETLKSLTWNEEWLGYLETIGPVQVWELASRSRSVLVVAASLVDVRLTGPGRLEFLPAGNEEWERLNRIWSRHASKEGLDGRPVFFSLTGPEGWSEGFGPLAQPGRVRVLCRQDESGRFERLHPAESVPGEVRIFLDNLRPDTASQRAKDVLDAFKRHTSGNAPGHFTLKLATEQLDLPTRLARAAFAALQSEGLTVFKTPSGELALVRGGRPDAIQLKASGAQRSPFVRHAALIFGSVIAVAAWLLTRKLTESVESAAVTIPVMILISYLVDRVRSLLRRWSQLENGAR